MWAVFHVYSSISINKNVTCTYPSTTCHIINSANLVLHIFSPLMHRLGRWHYVLWALSIGAGQAAVPNSPYPRIPALHNFRPELLLPDYDCSYLSKSWWDKVQQSVGSLGLLAATGSARNSGFLTDEAELDIFHNYAEFLVNRPWSAKDCHFADFMARLSLWSCCKIMDKMVQNPELQLHAEQVSLDCRELQKRPLDFSREMFGAGEDRFGLRTWEQLVVFMNSRFAEFFFWWARHTRDAFHVMKIQLDDEDLDCQSQVNAPSGWDWPGYLERVSDEAVYHEVAQAEGTVNFTMNTTATLNMDQKLRECPLGMVTILVHQLQVMMGIFTEEVTKILPLLTLAVELIEQKLKSPDWFLQASLQSRWPVMSKVFGCSLMVQAKATWWSPPKYQNKPYKLDFHPSELLYPADERHQLPHGAAPAALQQRRQGWSRSDCYAQLMLALQTSLEKAEPLGPRPVVIFTMVYGTRYQQYLPQWIQRAASFKHGARTVIFCLDEATASICRQQHPFPALCVPGEVKSTANKFHFMSVVVNSGFDVLYLDFDIVLFRDPLPPVLRAAEKADLLLTRDFGTECINIGVIFMKSHPDNAQFLQDLIIWLWHHPYEFCQKAFAGLMGQDDVQWNGFFGEIVKTVPRWGFLDSLNSFVTSTIYGNSAMGWTGQAEEIVIYHFLDGTGEVDPSYSLRSYVNLFDLFYANDWLNLSDTETPLYVQDPQVRSQLDFSKLDGPIELQPCSLIEEDVFPPWKLEQRSQLRKRRDIQPVEV